MKNGRKAAEERVGSHLLAVPRCDGKRKAVAEVAKAIPAQHVPRRRYARISERLGSLAAARYRTTNLPATKTMKSAELGEVLARSYGEERADWGNTVNQLRWNDHREMPMRGDDLLAIRVDGRNLSILKGEGRSR